jgi:hypothetical protein
MISRSMMRCSLCFGVVALTPIGCNFASAQQVVTIRATIGDAIAPNGSDITKRSMERFCELLALSEDSRGSAMSLHEGYIAERKSVRAERQQEILAIQKQAQDDGDDSAFISKLPEVTTRGEKRLREIESRFMNDFKLLCDAPDADERWERVERARRRETVLRIGASAMGGVDLLEVLREMKPDATDAAAIDALCLEYEGDLDRALLAKQRLLDEQAANGPKSLTDFDPEEMEKSRIAMKEAATQIADLNTSHARKIGAVMSDGTRMRFEQLLKERSYPRIYRQSKVAKDLVAALGFADLTEDQRKSLESMREQYDREVQTLNEAWESAVRAQDDAGADVAVSFGGSVGMLRMGDEPEPIARARKAKKDNDAATREKLSAVLTPEQRERLPKEVDSDVGNAIMIDGGTTIRMIEKPEPK